METWKKSEPQMGFEPTNPRPSVIKSDGLTTELLGNSVASKGEMWVFD